MQASFLLFLMQPITFEDIVCFSFAYLCGAWITEPHLSHTNMANTMTSAVAIKINFPFFLNQECVSSLCTHETKEGSFVCLQVRGENLRLFTVFNYHQAPTYDQTNTKKAEAKTTDICFCERTVHLVLHKR